MCKAPPWAAESDDLLSPGSLRGARQSRGLPIAPPADARLAPLREQGRRLFHAALRPTGLLVCAVPRPALAGRPPGRQHHPARRIPTGYPIYRLEWQGLGSLQRRLRGCFGGVRADLPAFGSADLVALELHLMQRAAGLALESPGVRP